MLITLAVLAPPPVVEVGQLGCSAMEAALRELHRMDALVGAIIPIKAVMALQVLERLFRRMLVFPLRLVMLDVQSILLRLEAVVPTQRVCPLE
jgi:hypothetical protein